MSLKEEDSAGATGGGGVGAEGLVPPNPKGGQKLSKKNGIKLVGCTFRLKNYVKIRPILSDFSVL